MALTLKLGQCRAATRLATLTPRLSQLPPEPAMTGELSAEALTRLAGIAEDVGLDPETVLAELMDMAAAMRLCVDQRQQELIRP